MRINYNHKIAQLITTAFVVVLLSLNAFAGSVPPYMNYQGILKDTSTGDSLATGDYQIQFSLYDAPEGAPGAVEVWSQIIEPVKVVDGHFSVLLGGEENSLPDSFNSPDRFIEVHVGSVGDIPDNLVKLSNRQRIVGVGYAFSAGDGIPSGAIMMFDKTCPTNYTRFAELDGRFPMGNISPGNTGGGKNHTHTVEYNGSVVITKDGTAYSSLSGQVTYQDDRGFIQNYYQEPKKSSEIKLPTERFTVSGSSGLPPYRTVVYCMKN